MIFSPVVIERTRPVHRAGPDSGLTPPACGPSSREVQTSVPERTPLIKVHAAVVRHAGIGIDALA